MASSPLLAIFIFFIVFRSVHVMGDLVLEEGYTVSTVIDGNKLNINPHSILPVSGSSDFIVLDSSSSSFYSLSLPMSQGSVIKPFSGNGTAGFSDGVFGSSMFNKPRSFAVDVKGNVYVADKNNHAIRKISSSGVSTIAGGYSQKAGFADGPAQHALFSDDFELAFVPEKCALLISDHGSKLIRQIDLRHEDCVRGSHSVLGATALWTLGLGLSCILGLIIGFVVRPYVAPRTGNVPISHFDTDMEALPNPSGETSSDVLLRHQKRNC